MLEACQLGVINKDESGCADLIISEGGFFSCS